MATKKKTAETEVKAETYTTPIEAEKPTREEELLKALEAEKKKNEELLKEAEALKAEAEEYRANDLDMKGTHDEAYWNEKINYYVPFWGDEEDIVVRVNGESVRVMRGETVKIKRKFAAVLENQMAQMMYSKRHNDSLQEQYKKDTKKYTGEDID